MNFKKFGIQVPSEYQEIEYLESNGTQYIDTNIIPSNSAQTNVQFEFQLTDITNGIYQSIGCNSNMNFTSSQTLLKFRSNAIEISKFDTAWHICGLSKSSSGKVTYFDGVEYSTSTTTEEALPFILFGMSLSSNRYYGKYKLKYFKCYENNTLVRNMIPVRRVSDNVLGLYDLANNVFYTNQGTGSFIAGSDVNNWTNTPHYIHNTSTDTITLPADIYANDTTATVGLKGNMSQSSTPTPTTPIQPQECGERTGNLFDKSATDTNNGYIAHRYLKSDGDFAGNDQTTSFITEYIDISGLSNITLSQMNRNSVVAALCFYDSTKTYLSGVAYQALNEVTTSVPANAKYLRFTCYYLLIDTAMLNTGSTALPYEPYGIKIPISSANTTTPVYLGEVESTRRIKKLVLTGNETFNVDLSYDRFFFSIMDMRGEGVRLTKLYCTHYQNISDGRPIANVPDNSIYTGGGVDSQKVFIKTTDYTTVTDFKAYLAQQYAAGTPVTVWYVLAEPTTSIVNEPIRKIGDYADSVSGITIPVTAGANTLSVGTTLQPSEVSLNYKGWHPVADVHKKSRNLFDKDNVDLYEGTSLSVANKWYYAGGQATTIRIPCEASTLYTLKITASNTVFRISTMATDDIPSEGKDVVATTIVNSSEITEYSFTTPSNAKYILFQGSYAVLSTILDTLMLNEGSTALPYEPYWT